MVAQPANEVCMQIWGGKMVWFDRTVAEDIHDYDENLKRRVSNKELREWLRDNVENYTVFSNSVSFEDYADAVLCRIRFS